MRRLMMVAVYTVLAFGTAAAQDVTGVGWPLDSGSRVRILSASLGARFREGTVAFASNDSMVVKPRKDSAFSVATRQITTLQVARGTHTSKARYALIGLFFGALGGAAIGSATYSPPKCTTGDWCFDFGEEFATAGGAIVGALIGTVGGAIWGSSPRDTWVPVAVPSR